MLEGSGGVSHGRLVGSSMVVLRCRCFESSAGLGSGGRRGGGGEVRREVHSIVIRGEGSSARGSSRGPSLLRRRERRLSSEFIGVSGRIGPSLRETGVQTSLGSSGRSRGGSVRELSWGGLTEFSTEEWLLGSQEQQAASVSADSQEEAPKESQS